MNHATVVMLAVLAGAIVTVTSNPANKGSIGKPSNPKDTSRDWLASSALGVQQEFKRGSAYVSPYEDIDGVPRYGHGEVMFRSPGDWMENIKSFVANVIGKMVRAFKFIVITPIVFFIKLPFRLFAKVVNVVKRAISCFFSPGYTAPYSLW